MKSWQKVSLLCVMSLWASSQVGCTVMYGAARAGWLRNGSMKQVKPVGPKEMDLNVTPSSFKPFRATCDVKRRNGKEKVVEHSVFSVPGWNVLYGISAGMMGLFVAGVTAGAIQSLNKEAAENVPVGQRSWGLAVVAAGFGLDLAVGLILNFALPPKNRRSTKTWIQQGRWKASQLCPVGLRLQVGGANMPLNSQGRLTSRNHVAHWTRSVLGGASHFSLIHGPRKMDYRITPTLRCVVARHARPPGWQRFCPSIHIVRTAELVPVPGR